MRTCHTWVRPPTWTGVASAWMLREMKDRGMAPLALLLNAANPILAQGAAFAGLVLVDRFPTDITRSLASGQRVRVDPRSGEVAVLPGES